MPNVLYWIKNVAFLEDGNAILFASRVQKTYLDLIIKKDYVQHTKNFLTKDKSYDYVAYIYSLSPNGHIMFDYCDLIKLPYKAKRNIGFSMRIIQWRSYYNIQEPQRRV